MAIHFDPNYNQNYYNTLNSINDKSKTGGSYVVPTSSGGTGDDFSSYDYLMKKLEQDFPNIKIAVGDYNFMTNQPLNGVNMGSGSGNYLISPGLLSRISGDPSLVSKFEEMLAECEKSEEMEMSFLGGLEGYDGEYDSGFIFDESGHVHNWGKPRPTTSQTGPMGTGFNPMTITSQTGPVSEGVNNPNTVTSQAETAADLIDQFAPDLVQSRVDSDAGENSILNKLADEKAEEINEDLYKEADAEAGAVANLMNEEAADQNNGMASKVSNDAVYVQQLTKAADGSQSAAADITDETTMIQAQKSVGQLEQLSDLSRILSKLDEQKAESDEQRRRFTTNA